MSRLKGCAPQRCYVDHVDAWSVNEVAINWNAPLAWIAAYLDEKGNTTEGGSP
jgi:endoglucanase